MTGPRAFAIEAHGDQKYGSAPYIVHLDAVRDVLVRFGFQDEDLLTAALLHDVIEDTPVDADLVEEKFGAEVCGLVVAVTNEPGRNRRERHRLTYPKIRNAGWKAIALKLADRIANVEQSLSDASKGRPKPYEMYRHEHQTFSAALRVPCAPGIQGAAVRMSLMWSWLDSKLGFEDTTPAES